MFFFIISTVICLCGRVVPYSVHEFTGRENHGKEKRIKEKKSGEKSMDFFVEKFTLYGLLKQKDSS